MKEHISDSQLQQATALVRTSMLNALDSDEKSLYEFSDEFEIKVQALQQKERLRRTVNKAARRCAAAMLALLVGAFLFLAFNVEARAAVITWFKEFFEDKIIYRYVGDPNGELPEYTLTWIPDDMECVYDVSTTNSHAMVYIKSDEPQVGFTFDYNRIQDGSATIMDVDESDYIVTPVDINGNFGELYISRNSENTHSLIWFDEERKISFGFTFNIDVDVILHIAKSIELSDYTN